VTSPQCVLPPSLPPFLPPSLLLASLCISPFVFHPFSLCGRRLRQEVLEDLGREIQAPPKSEGLGEGEGKGGGQDEEWEDLGPLLVSHHWTVSTAEVAKR
jgi:hypothetical protein